MCESLPIRWRAASVAASVFESMPGGYPAAEARELAGVVRRELDRLTRIVADLAAALSLPSWFVSNTSRSARMSEVAVGSH